MGPCFNLYSDVAALYTFGSSVSSGFVGIAGLQESYTPLSTVIGILRHRRSRLDRFAHRVGQPKGSSCT